MWEILVFCGNVHHRNIMEWETAGKDKMQGKMTRKCRINQSINDNNMKEKIRRI